MQASRKCFQSIILPLAMLALLAGLAAPAAAQCDGIANCTLVWSDEFDGTELDLTKWTHQLGDGSDIGLPGWGNNELQYYQAENATVANGFLTITAKEESVGGRDYTSSRIRSLGKGDWTFGRFEMRAKFPEGQGFWPAFWMLSSDPSIYGVWAASGEIDIVEYLGNAPNEIFATIHYGASFPGNQFSSIDYTLDSGNFVDDFHVFAAEWENGEIRWYVDGELYATQTDWFSTGGPYPAPFNVDFHLLLNMAVGGNFPGPPDATTVFPAEYVIDYVRVYQGDAPTPPTVEITSPAAGSNVPAGSTVNVVADVTADEGVAFVEFFQGPFKIGEDSVAPFEVEVTGVAAGCYTLNARAQGNNGLPAFADPVDFSVGNTCAPAPVTMQPTPIPGRVEIENYDIGGPGVAYDDFDPSNNGGAFRPDEGVDLESTADVGGGFNLGWTEAGESITYTVDVTAGTYDVVARIASESLGGEFYLEVGGVDVTGPIAFPATGGWQSWTNVEVEGVELLGGVQTLRFVINQGGFNINYIDFEEPGPCEPAGGPKIFDDMEHGNPFGSGWFAFGGAVGGGGLGPVTGDVPPENGGTFSIGTGWGSGGVPGFFGGFGRGFTLDLTDAESFSFWINPDAGQDFTLEINLQDDDNGDNVIPFPPDANDDEFQYNCVVSPTGPCAISGGGWQLVTIPLADFFDDNSFLFGGNGVLDAISTENGGNGQLLNIVFAVISNSGADATFRTDYWVFDVPPPVLPSEVVFDDMEHCNPFGSGYFTFFGAGGGGIGPNFDVPPAFGGVCSMETGWGGGGPGFYGGFGRSFPVDTFNTTHFGFWIDPDPDLDFTIEINFQEDDAADNTIPFPPNGTNDEFQFNCRVSAEGPCAVAGGGWQFVSIPLADFFDDNSFLFGGNGILDPVSPDAPRCGNGQLINVVMAIISNSGAPAVFRTDYWTFTEGSLDADGDRQPDAADNCPNDANSDQADFDGDGIGDVCDPDVDGDGVDDTVDNCLLLANPDQADFDGDGEGDACDADDDGDGVLDEADVCAETAAGDIIDGDGCSIDQICPCDADWKNHGKYVSCVSKAATDFMKAGLITGSELGAIVSEAAGSTCGQK